MANALSFGENDSDGICVDLVQHRRKYQLPNLHGNLNEAFCVRLFYP